MLLRALVTGLLALFLCAPASFARNGSESLNHYGLVTLSDNAVGARLASRFKARGQPVFLVHDLNAGLSQNDIMRFADKAVLVDADVWSTLQAEGALDKLRSAPLVRVQGRATAASWGQRAGIVAGERQRKAFQVGAELLRVLEENFGGAPQGQQLTLVFEQDHLTLLAPTGFLDQLSFANVRKVLPSGKPTVISMPPDTTLFTGQPFEYQIWGADPTNPSGDLSYQILGTLPPGLTWNAATHTLQGSPTASGRWRLIAQVQNEGGLRDTAAFFLRFRMNQAPLLGGEPMPIAVTGREWRFAPQPSDPDHPGYALKVRPGVLAPGMQFSADSGILRWVPDAALAGSRHNFSLLIEDALGAKREFRYSVQVVAREGILLSEGVTIELPWDTLLRGRTYLWRTRGVTAAWASQGIQLQEIHGSDSTLYEGDSILRVTPREAGIHQLDFRFTAQGRPLAQSLFIPVREDLPPEFVTEVSEWKMRDGDSPRRYRPVAVDPEGEPIRLTAHLPEGSPLVWDGRRLHYDPANLGYHPARFTATDLGGKTAEQWVVFQSEPQRASAHWLVESRLHGEFTAWTATMDFGTGRVGVYLPNFVYGSVPWSYWLYKETPFFFLGGNLMGRKAEEQGRILWADLGFALRNPSPRIITGGIYTRLNGEWHFPGSPLSWIEMEATGHIHQAMAATDSAMFFTLLHDPNDIISRDTISKDGPLSSIIREGFRDDNVRFFTRIEALGPLGYGIFIGPTLWREDIVVAKIHNQHLGGVLRFKHSELSDTYQFSMRIGWGPGGDGWGGYATMRLSFGAPY
jgi:hypothetical protein